MCCPLNQIPIIFEPKFIRLIEKHNKKFFLLKGYLNTKPLSFIDKCIKISQRIELAEKITEIADEAFHLFGSLLKSYTPSATYQFFYEVHQGAHQIEHLLHSLCFFGNLLEVCAGKFIVYDHHLKKIIYIRTAARVCHLVSHFLYTTGFISDLKLCLIGPLSFLIAYRGAFSALGYALWLSSLLWNRYIAHQEENHFLSNTTIHLGGAIFEGISFISNINKVTPYCSILFKISAIAAIVHAGLICHRMFISHRKIQVLIDPNLLQGKL